MKKQLAIIMLSLGWMFCVQSASAQKNEKIVGEIFSYVDTVPQFMGGREAMIQFLTTNMVFPPKATKEGVKKGKVYLEFIVKADGSLANIKISKTSDEAFNKEAIRLFTIMPNWKAGVLNGKQVNSRLTFPIKFGYDSVLDTK